MFTHVELGAPGNRVWTDGKVPKGVEVLLYDGGKFAGLIWLRPQASGGSVLLFRVDEVFDQECDAVSAYENASRGGDPKALQNWDTLRRSS